MIRLALLRFFETYFRHRWLYLLPIPIMVAAGVFYFITVERLYLSGGVLYVQSDSFLGTLTSVRDAPFSYLTPAQLASGEIQDLLLTDAFVRSMIEETDIEAEMSAAPADVGEILKEVREAVWAQPIGNNEVTVRASHENPVLSYQLSTAAINKYIQWKINLDRVQSGTAEEFFQELTTEYEIELEQARDDLREYLTTHPEPVRGSRSQLEQLEINRLEALLQMAGTRYTRALEKDENARLATSQAEADVRQTYFLVDAPIMPIQPETSRRQIATSAAIFVVAGIVLTFLGVVVGTLLDRSFRFPIDVHHGLGLPVLAGVPDARPKHRFWQIGQKNASQAAERGEALEETSEEPTETQVIETGEEEIAEEATEDDDSISSPAKTGEEKPLVEASAYAPPADGSDGQAAYKVEKENGAKRKQVTQSVGETAEENE